jgi:hypothetical protein
VETIPAGALCDFAVKIRQWGTAPRSGSGPTSGARSSTPSSTWHLLLGPEGLQYEKYFHDRTSVWDGTADDINGKICEFLS